MDDEKIDKDTELDDDDFDVYSITEEDLAIEDVLSEDGEVKEDDVMDKIYTSKEILDMGFFIRSAAVKEKKDQFTVEEILEYIEKGEAGISDISKVSDPTIKEAFMKKYEAEVKRVLSSEDPALVEEFLKNNKNIKVGYIDEIFADYMKKKSNPTVEDEVDPEIGPSRAPEGVEAPEAAPEVGPATAPIDDAPETPSEADSRSEDDGTFTQQDGEHLEAFALRAMSKIAGIELDKVLVYDASNVETEERSNKTIRVIKDEEHKVTQVECSDIVCAQELFKQMLLDIKENGEESKFYKKTFRFNGQPIKVKDLASRENGEEELETILNYVEVNDRLPEEREEEAREPEAGEDGAIPADEEITEEPIEEAEAEAEAAAEEEEEEIEPSNHREGRFKRTIRGWISGIFSHNRDEEEVSEEPSPEGEATPTPDAEPAPDGEPAPDAEPAPEGRRRRRRSDPYVGLTDEQKAMKDELSAEFESLASITDEIDNEVRKKMDTAYEVVETPTDPPRTLEQLKRIHLMSLGLCDVFGDEIEAEPTFEESAKNFLEYQKAIAEIQSRFNVVKNYMKEISDLRTKDSLNDFEKNRLELYETELNTNVEQLHALMSEFSAKYSDPDVKKNIEEFAYLTAIVNEIDMNTGSEKSSFDAFSIELSSSEMKAIKGYTGPYEDIEEPELSEEAEIPESPEMPEEPSDYIGRHARRADTDDMDR